MWLTVLMQKGPLWWAGHHVNHHKYADRDGDPHSPMVSGFYYAHIGWFLNDARHDRLEATNPVMRDFSKAPEIVWLNTFFWAFVGTAAMQKGPLRWAGHHVNHHRFADREGDPHSPSVSGIYYAHIGWFLNDAKNDRLEPTNPVIRDFSKAPEIVWLERYMVVPPLALAIAMYLIGGFPWLVWGFCLPTMTLAHATFAINTVNHMFGSRRFETRDESRNNPITAFCAVGEGWHNNHHRYQRSARNGFYWWEFDVTWYVIRAMAAVGLAWDLQPVPPRIYEEAQVVKEKRAALAMPSIVDGIPLALELAEDGESA
jgi:stearoyl-CoA desaturase (delta-9 desaturase)